MFFQNSYHIRLYQNTPFRIDFGLYEVPKIDDDDDNDVDDDDDEDDDNFDDDNGD